MRNTPKICLVLVMCGCLLCGPAFGGELDAFLLPTLSPAWNDFWIHVPLDSGPQFSHTGTVFPDQEFTLLLFIRGYEKDKDNNINVTYDLKVYGPDGESKEDRMDNLVAWHRPLKRSKTLILPEQIVKLVFTEKYTPGLYTIKIRLHDWIAGVEANKEVSVKLVPYAMGKPFSSPEEAENWMMKYFRHPEPSRIVPAMNSFVKVDRNWLTENASMLTFFTSLFKDNGYLLKETAKEFDHFTPDEKKRLVLMASLIDSHILDSVIKTEDLKEFRKFARTLTLPDTNEKIETAEQLDSLWAEFLATGRYDPVRKIVSSLELSRYKGTLDKIKSGKLDMDDSEVQRRANFDATWQSAIWSLRSNCLQFLQVYKYCLFMYENEELDDDIRKQLGWIINQVQEQINGDM